MQSKYPAMVGFGSIFGYTSQNGKGVENMGFTGDGRGNGYFGCEDERGESYHPGGDGEGYGAEWGGYGDGYGYGSILL